MWIAVVARFELTHAYPFVSLSFVLVPLFGATLLGESLTAGRVVGILLIVLGLVVGSQW